MFQMFSAHSENKGNVSMATRAETVGNCYKSHEAWATQNQENNDAENILVWFKTP